MMRDFRDAKLMAKELRAALAARGVDLGHGETLELVARQFGERDWNTLSAAIGAAPSDSSMVVSEVIPILRIFDVGKAREFYEGFLGFKMNWEHRYSPVLPLYAEIERAGMKLHLSEHHGDASPGSTVFVWMTGLRAFHAELMEKRYGYSRPGLETTEYGALLVEVPDPFGNRIRFNERI